MIILVVEVIDIFRKLLAKMLDYEEPKIQKWW